MTKIEALKKTIFNLENGVYEYDWERSDTCNCGVLARTLLDGRLASECGLHLSPKLGDRGVFSKLAFCITTDLPLPQVYRVLKDTGFTHQELLELEYLSNKRLGEMAALEMYYSDDRKMTLCRSFHKKESVISYLKSWVQILEEDAEKDTDIAPVTHVYQDLTESIASLPIIEERSDAVGSRKGVVNQE